MTITKHVDVDTLESGDVIWAAMGAAEVESASEGCVTYRYLDSGDYHERYMDTAILLLSHPAIGKARAAGRIQ